MRYVRRPRTETATEGEWVRPGLRQNCPRKRRRSVVGALRGRSQSARGLVAHAEPAVDGDHGTGDVGGVIVQQRGDDMSQLLGSAEAP
jgi:hypothetical protein